MKKKKTGFWRHLLFLGPASAAFFIAVLIPFIISMGYAFTDWNGVANEVNFVAFQNFIDIFTGKSRFLDSFWFTLKITIVNVVLICVVGTLLAVALTSKMKGTGVFRVMFYLPQTIGGLILGFVWQFIFVNGFPGNRRNVPYRHIRPAVAWDRNNSLCGACCCQCMAECGLCDGYYDCGAFGRSVGDG